MMAGTTSNDPECPGRSETPADSVTMDPDDAPEFTDVLFDRAEVAVGGTVLKPASGTIRLERRSEGPGTT